MARAVIGPVATHERRLRMSYEEWAAWGEQEFKSEWVDGEVIVFMSASLRHVRLQLFVYALLAHCVSLRDLGEVFANNVEMRLERAARVPDILFVARRHLDRLTSQRLKGAADLVIEFISPDSVDRDREEKFAEYAAAGVDEYWIIDSRSDRADARFYHLIDGVYREVLPDEEGRYRSLVVDGFWFRVDWLWQEPLPNPWPLVALIAPDAAHAALAGLERGDDGRG